MSKTIDVHINHIKRLFAVLLWGIALLIFPAAAVGETNYEGELELTFETLPNGDKELRAHVIATGDEGTFPVEGMFVNFYANSVSRDGGLGNEETDEEGQAIRIIKADAQIPMDEEGQITFIARSDHRSLGLLESEIQVKMGVLNARIDEEERAIAVEFLQALPDGTAPIAYSPVNFFIKRSFGNIAFGGDFTYTDDDGLVVVEFPEGIPGDEEGRVHVIALVEDHPEFATLRQVVEVPLGEAVAEVERERALWAGRAYAPWWLLIVGNLLLFGIWAAVLYVFLLIARIKTQDR